MRARVAEDGAGQRADPALLGSGNGGATLHGLDPSLNNPSLGGGGLRPLAHGKRGGRGLANKLIAKAFKAIDKL